MIEGDCLDLNLKEVYFCQYCKRCKHFKLAETEEPCSECLEYGANENSHKPRKFEEKK